MIYQLACVPRRQRPTFVAMVRAVALALGLLLILPTTSSARPVPRDSDPTTFVRKCRTSVYGELAHDWREDALKLGRVWFLYLETSGPPAGSWTRFKVLVVVRRGPPVKVSVAPTDGVALAYNPATFNGADTVEEGNASVRFRPCRPGTSPYPQAPRKFTQFNGGWSRRDFRCAQPSRQDPRMTTL